MGCASSKLDADDAVRRARDRRRHVSQAVAARHLLAAALSDYLRALRLSAASLSSFSKLHPHLSLSSSPLSPPPPPETRPDSRPVNRYPHLPSYAAATPSQASSAWDWEKCYPPSPPPSEFFDRVRDSDGPRYSTSSSRSDDEDDRLPTLTGLTGLTRTGGPPSEYPSPPSTGFRTAKTRRDDGDESVGGRHWRGGPTSEYESSPLTGFTRTKTRRDDRDELVDRRHWRGGPTSEYETSPLIGLTRTKTRTEDESSSLTGLIGLTRFTRREDDGEESVDGRHWTGGPPSECESSSLTGMTRREEGMTVATTETGSVMEVVVRQKDLEEIAGAIEDLFCKAAEAGAAAAELLEVRRGAPPERGFGMLRKRVYHSNSILSNLSATLSSKPPLEVRYELNNIAMEGALKEGDGDRVSSHCSALEKLLTWEKKLYKEVKEREAVKIELERKLLALHSMESRGRVDERVEKTKASIARLQSHIVVTSQAAETTSAAIIRVRDQELDPQLLRLCSGMAGMWRAMNHLHEEQAQVVQQVKRLVDRSPTVEPTSSLLRHVTKDLESAVAAWHGALSRLMQHQRDYVRALLAWLRLSAPVSGELCAFLEDWAAALDRAPDASAVGAVKNFAAVVASISQKQAEELKVKKRADGAARELEKKTVAMRAVEKKVYAGFVSNGDPLAERRGEVAAWRRRAEDEAERLLEAAKMTREMTLKSIQHALPGVFQSMAGFSGSFADALEGVCWR